MSTTTNTGSTAGSTTGTPAGSVLPPAKTPTGSGPIGAVGPVLALLLTALGVVLVHDALAGRSGGTTWLGSLTDSLVGLSPAPWMVAVGVVLVLVGLWLVVTALRPRTRDSLDLRSATGAHLGSSDVARRASAAASDVDGVLSAKSSAGRRKVVVRVVTTGDAATPQAVRAAVDEALAGLQHPPATTVRTTTDSEKVTS